MGFIFSPRDLGREQERSRSLRRDAGAARPPRRVGHGFGRTTWSQNLANRSHAREMGRKPAMKIKDSLEESAFEWL